MFSIDGFEYLLLSLKLSIYEMSACWYESNAFVHFDTNFLSLLEHQTHYGFLLQNTL